MSQLQSPKKTKKRSSQTDPKKPFLEHLNELRSRLVFSFSSALVLSAVAYFFHQKLLSLLLKPLDNAIYYTSPSGAFDLVFKLCIFSGFLGATPIFIFNLIKFLEPLMKRKRRRRVFVYVLTSILLLILGIVFAYIVALPAALHFLEEFSSEEVQSLITTKEYFSFVSSYLIGFGIVFQLPLVLLILDQVVNFEIRKLFSFQKYIILISFIVAAILTPTPDVINQLIMALPIILLYQISIGILFFQKSLKK